MRAADKPLRQSQRPGALGEACRSLCRGRADDPADLRPTRPIVGREALLAAFLGRPARTSQHIVGNIVVDVEKRDDGQRRTASSCCSLHRTSRPSAGSYRDRFVLTGEGLAFLRAPRRADFPVGLSMIQFE
jgi:hypothetical protein